MYNWPVNEPEKRLVVHHPQASSFERFSQMVADKNVGAGFQPARF